jgi:hypothetical protein
VLCPGPLLHPHEAYDHGAAALAELTANGRHMMMGLARSKSSSQKSCCSYWRWRRSTWTTCVRKRFQFQLAAWFARHSEEAQRNSCSRQWWGRS